MRVPAWCVRVRVDVDAYVCICAKVKKRSKYLRNDTCIQIHTHMRTHIVNTCA